MRRNFMAEQINALAVHAKDESYNDLIRVLASLSIKVIHAESCREASMLLTRNGAIDLVFAGANLQDRGWTDVLRLAQQAKSYLPVIVDSRMVDVGFIWMRSGEAPSILSHLHFWLLIWRTLSVPRFTKIWSACSRT